MKQTYLKVVDCTLANRMWEAVINDDGDAILKLEKEGADINGHHNGWAYIHAAAKMNNFSAFGALLMLRADRSDRPDMQSLPELIYDSDLCTTVLFESRGNDLVIE